MCEDSLGSIPHMPITKPGNTEWSCPLCRGIVASDVWDFGKIGTAGMEPTWGKTLVIANPAAQSGRGREGAIEVERTLKAGEAPVASWEMRLTTRRDEAAEIAAQAGEYDTVLVLGGDGVIHEAVNGLMRLSESARPRLGVLPLGSGNDFARTLGVASRNKPADALRELASSGTERTFDLGFVSSDAEPAGIWFMQTLSFGLDAAIALGSMETRKGSGAHGTRLFGALGLDVFAHNRDPFPYTATLWEREDSQPVELAGEEVVFAVQVGPTYGGGFRICPEASPTDGLLDLCRSLCVPSVPHTLALFARARLGLHAGSPVLEFRTVSRMTLAFTQQEPPCQADGEALHGIRYEIKSIPKALRVIAGRVWRG